MPVPPISSRYISGLGFRHSVLVLLMLLTQKVQMVLFLLSRPVKVREVMMLHGAPRLASSQHCFIENILKYFLHFAADLR